MNRSTHTQNTTAVEGTNCLYGAATRMRIQGDTLGGNSHSQRLLTL